MSDFITSILGFLRDRKAAQVIRTLLLNELRGKSVSEVLMLLETLKKTGKPFGSFLAATADGVLDMPLSQIQKLLGTKVPVKLVNPPAARSTKEKVAKARKLKMSPARKAQLKIQGEYIGHLRNATPAQKKTAKAIVKKDGMKAAIKFLLKKPAVKPVFVKLAKKPKSLKSPKVAASSKTAKATAKKA